MKSLAEHQGGADWQTAHATREWVVKQPHFALKTSREPESVVQTVRQDIRYPLS